MIQNIYEACICLVIKDWDGCDEEQVREKLNNIVTGLHLMDQMFDFETSKSALQTAYDVLLNARSSYEYWIRDQFNLVEKVSNVIQPPDTNLHIRNVINMRFAKKMTDDSAEFQDVCGMVFVERFKAILNNHLNISQLPKNVLYDLQERIFPLGLTFQLMKICSMRTLDEQIKHFIGKCQSFKCISRIYSANFTTFSLIIFSSF